MSPAEKIALMRAMFDEAVSADHHDNFIGEAVEKAVEALPEGRCLLDLERHLR